MKEYKIITGRDWSLQKILNKWRHIYHLEILEMVSHNNVLLILLTRIEKRKDKENDIR
jgi:hypothetical protein